MRLWEFAAQPESLAPVAALFGLTVDPGRGCWVPFLGSMLSIRAKLKFVGYDEYGHSDERDYIREERDYVADHLRVGVSSLLPLAQAMRPDSFMWFMDRDGRVFLSAGRGATLFGPTVEAALAKHVRGS